MSNLEFGVFLDLATDQINVDQHLAGYRPLLAQAEADGFRSVWAGESYPRGGPGFQHLPSPMLVLAALSGFTSMRLGTGVTLLPVWDPLHLAYDSIVLDQISGGRFELGVGLGAMPTWKQFGLDPDTLGDRTDEQIRALRALWAGADGFHGDYVDIDGAIGPRPIQEGGPPIWVGGKITRSTRRAAELGDGYLAGTHFGLGMVRKQIASYRAALMAAGKEPGDGRVSVNRIVVLAEDAEQAWSDSAPYLEKLLRKYAAMKMFKGAEALAAAEKGDLRALQTAAAGMCLVGSPDDVIAELGAYLDAGVDQIQIRPAPGGMPLELATRTIELAGKYVLPALSETRRSTE
jgi:alkanesulfonate monooxygenase SsuD/methylene tetrahydromethanopterin reductase-like flavin-dependent oxidoreductase (luciferase family)